MKNQFFSIFTTAAIISFLMSSCTIDKSGEFHLTDAFWLIIILLIIVFTISIISGIKSSSITQDKLKSKGLSFTDLIKMGSYTGGHPHIDKEINPCIIYKKESDFLLCQQSSTFEMPSDPIGIIPLQSITNISLEDASSIEKKITLGRVLLVGVFALAWKKNKKNEIAYIAIDWNDGRFEHSTIFSFQGPNAMQNANTARNALLRLAK